MKIIVFATVGILLTGNLHAQDIGFSYQAVALDRSKAEGFGRDTEGEVLSNRNINVRFSISEGSLEGAEVYKEIHQTTTDVFGMFRLIVGRGEKSNNNKLEDLNWGVLPYFLHVEINLNNGFEYLGAEELLGSPYALNVKNQSLTINGNVITISDGNSITLLDNDPINEIQTLSLQGNTLSLSNGGGSVTMETGESVSQELTREGNELTLSNNGGTVSIEDYDSDPKNEIQDLQLNGDKLLITNNATATTIDLSKYLDDTQISETDLLNILVTNGYITQTEINTYLTDNGYLTAEEDGSITNEIQDLQLTGDNLLISNNATATTIDLSKYLDDTQISEANLLNIMVNNGYITQTEINTYLTNNGYLTAEEDGSITNEIQDLQLTGDKLLISNNATATNIDLSKYLDDTQISETDLLNILVNNGYITQTALNTYLTDNGYLTAEVDGSVTNEIQDLQLTGNNLTITKNGSATTIDLSTYSSAFATFENVTSNSPGVIATDDFVFGSTSLDWTNVANTYSRMFFDKSKGAFRAGYATNQQWNEANRGNFSAAWGNNTTASGRESAAWGWSNIASGSRSTAWGRHNTASALGSTAWGYNSTASGDYSTIWGYNSTGSGRNSTAWGQNSEAIGNYSTAWGSSSEASGNNSTAWGQGSEAGGSISTAWGVANASGYLSTAWSFASATGYQATAWGSSDANGANATAWGNFSEASGNYSSAWGAKSKATRENSTAWGYETTASGNNSTAWGYKTVAPSYSETAFGYNNTIYTPNSFNSTDIADRLFVIGNGTTDVARSDALIIYKSGNTILNGPLTIDADNIGGSDGYTLPGQDGTNGQIMTTDGSGVVSWSSVSSSGAFATASNVTSNSPGTIATDDFVFGSTSLNGIAGTDDDNRMFFDKSKGAFRAGRSSGTNWDDTNIGTRSFASGTETTASGTNSFASGNETTATGYASFASGVETTASGDQSFAIGVRTTASGAWSFSSGRYSVASGNFSTAMGSNTTASGDYSFATGINTLASSKYSFTSGQSTNASGNASFASGFLTTAPSFAEAVFGSYNTAYTPADAVNFNSSDRLFILGNGTSGSSRSDALIIFKNGNGTLAGSLTQSSDLRLKKDIAPLNESFTNITQLTGVHYKWNEVKPHDTESLQTGLIAQEVEKLFPELVTEGSDGYKSVNYIGLVPHLIEAIKELKKENETLKTAIDTQKNTFEERLSAIEKILENK